MSGGFKECQGVFRVYFVSETAQVELRSGRIMTWRAIATVRV